MSDLLLDDNVHAFALARVAETTEPIGGEMAAGLLELHSPDLDYGTRVCAHCCTGDPYTTVSDDWPCPTVRIVLRQFRRHPDYRQEWKP